MQPNPNPQVHRFDPSRVLLDPYARVLSNGGAWGAYPPGKRPYRNSVVVENHFDWGNDQPLNIPLVDSVIYEMHVRSFTRHPSSGVEHPGTFAGLIEKIPYLKKLGVTAVELLPVNEFEESDTRPRQSVYRRAAAESVGLSADCVLRAQHGVLLEPRRRRAGARVQAPGARRCTKRASRSSSTWSSTTLPRATSTDRPGRSAASTIRPTTSSIPRPAST